MRYIIVFCLLLAGKDLPACNFDAHHYRLVNDSTVSRMDSLKIALDAEAPAIKVNVEFNRVVLDQILLQDFEDGFPADEGRSGYPVGAYISLEKKGLGIEAIYIKVDKAHERLYTKPMKLSQRGHRTLRVRAVDQEGEEVLVMSLSINVVPQ